MLRGPVDSHPFRISASTPRPSRCIVLVSCVDAGLFISRWMCSGRKAPVGHNIITHKKQSEPTRGTASATSRPVQVTSMLSKHAGWAATRYSSSQHVAKCSASANMNIWHRAAAMEHYSSFSNVHIQ
ncbi:hypothetical protein HaLaN_03079 [Haematococcus lacustris]|uniref:Uncharacterized protein n=1 Tax=Haematococcus lacustris TaxID=44745 RepID=A0A699YFD3_HAELA|nr:hypothetical protein HaLaN_03079 [Haematococcus lacustris]